MENVPLYVHFIFGCTVLLGFILFYKASQYAKSFLFISVGWIILQSGLSIAGFYERMNTLPPRFPLLLLPPLLFIIICFNTSKGKTILDRLDIKALTLFSVIRIPVEIVLFFLFEHQTIPQLMTFAGRNFDILSGVTAPIIYYVCFIQQKNNKTILLIWNVVCLALLLNIVINAILSIPSSFQLFAFYKPNIAIAYFSFVLLPAYLVPLVLLSHLVSIRQIVLKKGNAE
jgi:hypothetical protein